MPHRTDPVPPHFLNEFKPKLMSMIREGYDFGDFRADVLAGLRRRGHKLLVTSAPLETAVQVALQRASTTPPTAKGARSLTTESPPASERPVCSAASDPRKGGMPATP